MNKLLLLGGVFFLLTFSAKAQIQQNAHGTIFFEQVYEVSGMSQAEIKSAVNEWLAINFNDANHVIKMNTEEKIINKGLVKSYYDWKGITVELTDEFDMITEFKEGKYRLTIDNITYKTSSGEANEISWKPEELSKEKFRVDFQSMIDQMEEGQVKRINERILKSDKKFNEHYETVMEARKKIYNSVVPEIENIASSLNSYVNKNKTTNEDW